MNICATGLSDRFFKVVMPTGCRDVGQFHGQCFKSGMFTRQEEREADDHSEETSRREQLVAQSDGRSRHGKPRRIKTGRAKDPRLHRAEISVERIQHPRLAQQLGKLDLAAASQWIVRPSDHDQGIMEKNFFRILLADGTRKS